MDTNAPSWVLIPGTLCTGAVFDPMLDALGVPNTKRHVIIPDKPVVTDYAKPLRTAVGQGDIVCGFSLGAIVAMHNLEALRGAGALVLLAANPQPDSPGNRQNRRAVCKRVANGEAAAWVTENWPSMSTADDADLRARVIADALAMAPHIDAQTELAASRPGAENALAATPLPVLYITGQDDPLTPPQRVQGLAACAPRARLIILPRRGHFALLENPVEMAQTLRAGLASLSVSLAPTKVHHDT